MGVFDVFLIIITLFILVNFAIRLKNQKESSIEAVAELALNESNWSDEKFDKISSALRIKSFKKQGDSKVLIVTKFDMFSFGEEIELLKNNDKIIIPSAPSYKLTKIDYNRNRKNVEVIKQILES